MGSISRPRFYDKSNKVLPLSQSQVDKRKEITPDDSSQESVYNKCKRTFKTQRGLQQHQRSVVVNRATQGTFLQCHFLNFFKLWDLKSVNGSLC